MADREHHVLGAADELGVLVIEREVGRSARLADDPADVRPPMTRFGVAELVGVTIVASVRISGTPGLNLRPRRAEERRRVAARLGVELGERRPVGGKEVRLGLGAQDRLAEVPGELLVGADRVRRSPKMPICSGRNPR